MKAWYVAKTKPNKEKLVERHLLEKYGVDVFLPYIRRPASKKTGLEPLFSTYLFCHVDPNSSDWPAIRWAPGVSYFLSTGHVLSPVPDELISQIEERVSMWNTGGYEPQFKPGERVSVLSGPFFGLEAIFQRYIPARQRCEVLLQTLNKLAKVEIPLNSLRQIDRYQNLTIAT